MKVGAVIPCYKMTHFLPAVLASLSRCNRVLVMNGLRPWESDELVKDDTAEVVLSSGAKNTHIIRGEWRDEAAQRTAGVNLLKDMDYVFTLDSDEILMPEDQDRMIAFAEESASQYQAFASSISTYYPDLEHRAIYDEGHTPIVMVRPSDFDGFSIIRCVRGPYISNHSVRLHHLKFLQPIEQIGWRLNSKYDHEKRRVEGYTEVKKSPELEQFLKSLGYENLYSQVSEVSFA